MQIFSGSANPVLASKVAKILGTKLGEAELTQFPNGETRVWVKEIPVEKRVALIQSMSSPTNEHLIEFCLMCDALHRSGTEDIVAVIPWMAYSKQDKVFRQGEPLSAKVAAQILQTGRIKKVITFDLHNRATLGFFDVPVIELSAKPLLVEYFRQTMSKNMMVVAPDSGSVKASTSFATELQAPVVYMDKKRDLVSGEVTVLGMSRSVEGMDMVIVDDNVFTGSTLLKAAEELKKAGAKTIRVGLTHHMYVPQVQEKLEGSVIDEVVVTDTVEPDRQVQYKKLKILSVAQMIVDELK